MDRIWQWVWDRYGARYSWAVFAIASLVLLPVYLFLSFCVVTFEKSDRYLAAAGVATGVLLVQAYVFLPPGLGGTRLAERWAAGHEVDQATALEDTYAYARGAMIRGVVGAAV